MERVSGKRRWIVGSCLGLFLATCLVIIAVVWMLPSSGGHPYRNSALATSQEWARVARIPQTATSLNVEAKGSAFSREFEITFRDKPVNISTWISASPGPSSTTPSVDDSGWTVYSYAAGGGAVFAEIRVSPQGDEVQIRTYWS